MREFVGNRFCHGLEGGSRGGILVEQQSGVAEADQSPVLHRTRSKVGNGCEVKGKQRRGNVTQLRREGRLHCQVRLSPLGSFIETSKFHVTQIRTAPYMEPPLAYQQGLLLAADMRCRNSLRKRR